MEFKKLKVSNCKIVEPDLDIFINDRVNKEVKTLDPYPILVERKQNTFSILYGFKKVERFRRENRQYIPAYILEPTSFLDKIKRIIKYHKHRRDLYPLEIAKIINMLKKAEVDKATIATEIADTMGIDRGYQIIDEYSELREIPDYIVNYLQEKDASLKIYKKFLNRREKIFKTLIKEAKPTLGEFLDIKELLEDLAQRENLTIPSIVEENGIKEIIEQQGRQGLEKCHNILEEKRYPIKNKYEKKIKKELNKMNPPGFVSIQPDYTLETRNVTLEAKIGSEKDLIKLQNFINENNLDPIKNIVNMELSKNEE